MNKPLQDLIAEAMAKMPEDSGITIHIDRDGTAVWYRNTGDDYDDLVEGSSDITEQFVAAVEHLCNLPDEEEDGDG